MAQSITTYRYVSSYGIRTGSTDCTGYTLGVTPIVLASGQGTSSSSGTFSVNCSNDFTYVNLPNVLVGNANIVINATASQIYDHLEIMVKGGSTTYSVVLSGDVAAATSLTTSLTANKYLKYSGQFNGSVFILGSVQTA